MFTNFDFNSTGIWLFRKFSLGILALLIVTAQTMANDKVRMIYYEITLNTSLENAWDAWTTEDGIKSFFAPACEIDFRIDGKYDILFFPDNKPGLRGAEGMRIMAIEPHKMFSFTWNQTPDLPLLRPQLTLVNLKFEKISANKTKLIFIQTGWGDGLDWDKAYNYFTHAWGDVVLYRLQHRFDHGPIDWSNPPAMAAE